MLSASIVVLIVFLIVFFGCFPKSEAFMHTLQDNPETYIPLEPEILKYLEINGYALGAQWKCLFACGGEIQVASNLKILGTVF